MGARKSIGELLVQENLIDIQKLERAREEQKKTGARLSAVLLKLGYIKDADLAEFLGRQYSLPTIDLANFEIDKDAIQIVSAQLCKKYGIIPVQKSGRSLVVAVSDPSQLHIKDDLALVTRHKIEIAIASEKSIQLAIEKHYEASSAEKIDTVVTAIVEENAEEAAVNAPAVEVLNIDKSTEGEAPVIRFVNLMLADAIKCRASDIHIESYEKRFRIRFRVDGSLMEKIQPPQGSANSIISRLKILCKMDIAERRRPQDGRLKVKLANGTDIDFRVNCLPTLFGEKIVLRILDKSNLQVDMTKLGMHPKQLDVFKRSLNLPQGMILITGPTGSGKTTTVYSALAAVNTVDVNVSTAEDPVEFNLDGINQVQVNADIGFGFPEALRAFLRQDPEIIMVGEIRDLETASIAYKAASTGHLVISTLHTNDAPSTVTRLVSMGVPNYLVAEGTSLVVAQRLIKRICQNCISETKVVPEVLLDIGVPESELGEFNNLKRGEGCEKCDGTGLSGRQAIFEALEVSASVKDAIFRSASPLEMKRAAILKDGMISLRHAALLKLKEGMTSVEEVITGTVEDDL
jgi:type IV pilus assembly protein PilB